MDAIILDVNHFHLINERYGKAYGDDVLRRISEKVRNMVRDSGGIVCRRDSDTFMVYCPHREDYREILDTASVGLAGEDGSASRVRLRMGVYSNVDKSIDIEQRFDRAKIAADTVRGSFTKNIGLYDNDLHEKALYSEQLIESFFHIGKVSRGNTPSSHAAGAAMRQGADARGAGKAGDAFRCLRSGAGTGGAYRAGEQSSGGTATGHWSSKA